MATPPPTNPPPPVQLRLATGAAEHPDLTAALNKTALHLVGIQLACQLVRDIAARQTPLDDDNIEDLRRALSTLDAAGPLPGILGRLTRQVNSGPIGAYTALVDDLAFAVHLNDHATP